MATAPEFFQRRRKARREAGMMIDNDDDTERNPAFGRRLNRAR